MTLFMRQLRVAFYGPRGSGKTTAASEVASRLGSACSVISSADPLYELQEHVYGLAGKSRGAGQQNAEVLALMSRAIRTVSAEAIPRRVVKYADDLRRGIFICPDSRPLDRPVLAENGFVFVHITASQEIRARRRLVRGDVGRIDDHDDLGELVTGDRQITNDGSLLQLQQAVLTLIETLR